MRTWMAITAALIGGCLAAAFAWRYIEAGKREIAARETTVAVLRAARYIKPGEPITARVVKAVRVPAAYLEPTAVTEVDSLAGADRRPNFHARIAIAEGAQLIRSHLTDRRIEAGLSWILEPGQVAVTIPCAPGQAVGGLARPGDRVHVIATVLRRPGWERDETRLVARDVRVVAVDGALWDPDGAWDVDRNRKDVETERILVTLAVTAREAARIAFVGEMGAVSLALTSAFTETATPLLTVGFNDLR